MMFFKKIEEDIAAAMARDPAARRKTEVILCYPGFHAILFYRFSHALWRRRWFLAARLLSHIGRMLTGIEIHPGAEIGKRFFIDHGAGVVIGETAIIGDDVTLYHDVTLGGVAPAVDSASQANKKRHPTIRDGAIIGSGAAILGPIVIGEGARVGANAVVTKDVPAGVSAVGIPARVVMPQDREKSREFAPYGTNRDGMPDPMLRAMENLRNQVEFLMRRVEELEAARGAPPAEAPPKVVGGADT